MVRIALLGEYNPASVAHQSILRALGNEGVEAEWALGDLGDYQGIWAVPGLSGDMGRVLEGIRYARENGVPFLGTCGGFQLTLIEYARHVLGLSEADHLETNPQAALPLISPLACSLVGTTGIVDLLEGSQVAKVYGQTRVREVFNCNYGINPNYQHLLTGKMRIAGMDTNGQARVIELADHPFFIATLYQPERAISHPLIKAFVRLRAEGGDRGHARQGLGGIGVATLRHKVDR